MPLHIENDGPEIVASNFWRLELAAAGKFFLSINAGAFRLLIPAAVDDSALEEMATGRGCIVTRGPWPAANAAEALELLFDDNTPAPFAIHLNPPSFDRLPIDSDAGKVWTFSAWTEAAGKPVKRLSMPAHYRRADRLPYLKPL